MLGSTASPIEVNGHEQFVIATCGSISTAERRVDLIETLLLVRNLPQWRLRSCSETDSRAVGCPWQPLTRAGEIAASAGLKKKTAKASF